MKIPVDYNDPQSIAKLHVDSILRSSDRWRAIETGTTVPGAAGVASPFVSVRFDDWVTRLSSVSAIARLRLGVWSTNADEAWDVSSYLHGRLLAFPADDETSGYRYERGPSRDVDPDSSVPFSAFLIRLVVRARIIDLDD